MENQLISLYCERTLPGLWEEPLNAITNLAFIIASAFTLLLYRRQSTFSVAAHWDFLLLITLMFAIGIGSGLWHFYPTRFTVLADVIPIALFINVYLLSFFHRVFGFTWRSLLLVFMAFQLLNMLVLMSFSPRFLNGSIFYGPGWIILMSIGAYLFITKHRLHGRLLAAGGIFTASLIFRTMDREVCQWVPLGTHFIWHVLNAWLLYLLTSALIRQEAVNQEVKRRPVKT
ncbi:MAG: hypothetical protein LJE85_07445 [Gammaproteobacteria bacterium]|nr:hypothetical protein [Gammaproteobacteria bacterium]